VLLGLTSQSCAPDERLLDPVAGRPTGTVNVRRRAAALYASEMYAYVRALTFAFFAIRVAAAAGMFYWGACASNQMHAKLHRVSTPSALLLRQACRRAALPFSTLTSKADGSCCPMCTLLVRFCCVPALSLPHSLPFRNQAGPQGEACLSLA
jgi:hypothetical protein